MNIRYAVFLRCNRIDSTSVIHETAETAAEAVEKVSAILGKDWEAVGALPRNAKERTQ